MKILFVALTPFHYYTAYLIAWTLKRAFENDEKFNMDIIMLGEYLYDYCDNSADIWDNVIYVKTLSESPKNKILRFVLNTIEMKIKIKKFKKLTNNKIDLVFYFTDQNSITLNLLKLIIKRYPLSKRVLVEEGTAPYVNYFNIVVQSKYKILLKKLFKLNDLPHIGAKSFVDPEIAIVTNKDEINKDYAPTATKVNWPTFSFSKEASLNFINEHRLVSNGFTLDKQYENQIIFLSQPLSESGLINKKDEISFIKNLSELFRKNNQKLFVKFHPRESSEKKQYYREYGYVIIEGMDGLPFEVLVDQLCPKAILTVSSSAAITFSRKAGGNVFWLENLVIQISNLASFALKDSKGSIKVIDSFTQLEEELNHITQKGNSYPVGEIGEWKLFFETIIKNT